MWQKLNVESDAHAAESGLTRADMKVLSGALTYQDRTVEHVMTPLEDCFTLPLEVPLFPRRRMAALLRLLGSGLPLLGWFSCDVPSSLCQPPCTFPRFPSFAPA